MKFDLWKAISYIYSDRNVFRKFMLFSGLILLYFIIGIGRSFCISPVYFSSLPDRLSLALMNFAPYSMLQFLGFPVTAPYLISFDIGQLTKGGLDIYHLKAIIMILLAAIPLSYIIGYFICNTRNQILKQNSFLPDLNNHFYYLKKGFIYLCGNIILTLPFIVLNVLVAKGIYTYFNSIVGDDLGWLYAGIKPMLVICITVIFIFILFLYLSVGIMPYIADLKCSSIFKIKTVFKIIYENFKIYCKYIGHLLLFTILFSILISATMYLHRIILELKILNLESLKYINGDDLSSFVISLILILIMLPFLFWYFSIISHIQGQFLNYLLKKHNNEEIIITNQTPNYLKKIVVSLLFIFLFIFGFIFTNYYKTYATVKQYLNKLEFYGRVFYLAHNDNGDLDRWNVNNSYDVFNLIKDMLPLDKVCGNTDEEGACFEKNYPKLNGKGEIRITKNSFYKFKLKDGSTAALFYNFPKCNINDSASGDGPFKAICGSIWFDINGKKGPNIYGRDLFQLVITRNGELIPRGSEDDKVYSISEHCSNKKQSGDACGAWILYKGNLNYLKH